MTVAHDEKETLQVDVNIPEHADRVTTALFSKSRLALLVRDGAKCFICGVAHSSVAPLEAHHYPIERSLADLIDFDLLRQDAQSGNLGATQEQRDGCKSYDWSNPDIYDFVDNMLVNGMLLCKNHHTVGNEGIHTMPHPLWLAQRYAKEGYQFTGKEMIHHG